MGSKQPKYANMPAHLGFAHNFLPLKLICHVKETQLEQKLNGKNKVAQTKTATYV